MFYLNITGYTSVRDVRILTSRDWEDNEQVIRYCEEQQEKARENKANPIKSAWKAAYPYAKGEQVFLNKVNLMLIYPDFRNVLISDNPKNK